MAYVVFTWLLLCIYVSPPFTLTGDAPRVVHFATFDVGGIVLFLVFVFLGVLARHKDSSGSKQNLLVLIFLFWEAGILALSLEQFVTAWTSGDVATKQCALANGVGMLGVGWIMPVCLFCGRLLRETGRRGGRGGDDNSGVESSGTRAGDTK
jgi:hypothetical protein